MVVDSYKSVGIEPLSYQKMNQDNDLEIDLYDAWFKSRKNSEKKSIVGNENVFQQFMIDQLVVCKIKSVAASSNYSNTHNSSIQNKKEKHTTYYLDLEVENK